MSKSFARDKGQRAERAAVALLQPIVDKVYALVEVPEASWPKLIRNLQQSQSGGFDIAGIEWLALEIKHQESLNISAWWKQTTRQAGTTRVPVLMYKRNNVAWRIMMYGYLPAKELSVKCPVDIALPDFLTYFENRLTNAVKELYRA
jgi:hypothetical protein